MIAGRHNPLGRQGLPYAFRVEYLETDGRAYVDTGICPTANFTFDTVVAATSMDNTVFWGTRSSGTYETANYQCYLNWNPNTYYAANILAISSNSSNPKNWNSGVKPSLNETYEFKGITVVSTMNDLWHPILVCALNAIGVPTVSVGIPRVGRLTMYDSGVPVADIISVVDLDGVPCFYDRVRKVFLYTPVGAFTAGPRVADGGGVA